MLKVATLASGSSGNCTVVSDGQVHILIDAGISAKRICCGLTELGIDLRDERFVKDGHTLEEAMLRFRTADGGFAHLADEEADLVATEQAFYALVAMERQAQGLSSLYTMK